MVTVRQNSRSIVLSRFPAGETVTGRRGDHSRPVAKQALLRQTGRTSTLLNRALVSVGVGQLLELRHREPLPEHGAACQITTASCSPHGDSAAWAIQTHVYLLLLQYASEGPLSPEDLRQQKDSWGAACASRAISSQLRDAGAYVLLDRRADADVI